jgi:putative intracellular protease/amidase/YHS domain-containing protein
LIGSTTLNPRHAESSFLRRQDNLSDINRRKAKMKFDASSLTQTARSKPIGEVITMNRRELLKRSAALGLTAAGSLTLPGAAAETFDGAAESAPLNPLTPPANAPIPVAFLISEGAVVIDFCGPWEIFERVYLPDRKYDAFSLYTVAESAAPISAAGGLKITPTYTISNAPAPKVIVIPAQSPASEATKAWIRNATKTTDVTMSVCTGAFVLASTGLLAGKPATTHHGAYVDLAMQYPDIHVQRGARFVETGNLASAGGLTSGMDLALRVVERYFGRDVANQTASLLEYQGQGWLNPSSNAEFAKPFKQTAEHPVCAVCGMEIDRSQSSSYKGRTYYFCVKEHKQIFDATPEKFAAD